MAELLNGARNKIEYNKLRLKIEHIRVIPVDENISDIFISLVEKYSLSHHIGIPDTFIAATSLFYNVELYTLNQKDFKFIPNLKLYHK